MGMGMEMCACKFYTFFHRLAFRQRQKFLCKHCGMTYLYNRLAG